MKWILLFASFLFSFYYTIPGASSQRFDVDVFPHITYFPLTELVVPADGRLEGQVKLKCIAKGKQPLKYTWQVTSSKYTKKFETGEKNELSKRLPLHKDGYNVMCVVSNEYGTVFSDKRHIDITGITSPFKAGPSSRGTKIYYSHGHPLTVNCPSHQVHGAASYSWGVYRFNMFQAMEESKHHGITSTGSLVFSYVKTADVSKVLYCRVSVGQINYISQPFGFSHARSKTPKGSVFTLTPALVEKPLDNEIARRGSTKIMRCIPTGNPEPGIVWMKDGKIIYSGKNNMKLESYNRVLVISNITETHTGRYQCGYGLVLFRKLATTHLQVTGPPMITKRPPETMTLGIKQKFTLECQAKGMFSASQDPLNYLWYKDFEKIKTSRDITINRNALTVLSTQEEDSGVYQCVAVDWQGSTCSTSTRVYVKVIKCPAIPPPFYSKFIEPSCHIHSSFTAGARCTVLCNRGFFGKGRRNYRRCLENGGWSVMQYFCEDTIPPKLIKSCPKDIAIATEMNNSTGAQVTWKPPEAEDNSWALVTRIEPQGIKSNSHWFSVGENVVKYKFIDPSGKNVSCKFAVTVFTRTKIVTKAPSLIYILKDQSLSLPCIAKAYPIKPIYKWFKSTFEDIHKTNQITSNSHIMLLDGGERLVITNVTYDDSGKYVCEALNVYYNEPGVRDTAVLSIEVVDEVEWSPWQPWTKCDVQKCGKGSQARKRSCYKTNTQRSAMGCEGPESETKPCHVRCPTTAPPPPTTQPDLDNTGHSIDNKIIGKARDWIKQRSPWMYSWLDTTGGRVGFALSLGLLGTVIVLISWYCGRLVFTSKKKVRFADDQQQSDKESTNKTDNKKERNKKSFRSTNENLPVNQENTTTTPIYENISPRQGNNEPLYENTEAMMDHYYEDIPSLQGHNEPLHQNTEAMKDHFEHIPPLQGHNEPLYQNTDEMEDHFENTSLLEGQSESLHENTEAIKDHYDVVYYEEQYAGEEGHNYGNDDCSGKI